MLEFLMPYLTILPFGLAMGLAALGMLPSIAFIVRPNTPPTRRHSVFVCCTALVAAWAFLNAVVPLMTA